MDRMKEAREAPRCKAKSKATGERCRAPAVTGWNVCRCHGAGGGAPKGKRNGSWKHGRYSQEAIALRAAMARLNREARKAANALS